MLINRVTKRFLGVFCGSYGCEKCGPIKRRQLVRRVALGLEAGYPQHHGGLRPRFLTLTCPPGESVERSWEQLTQRFQNLRQLVVRRYNVKIEYARFVEAQQRGAPHLHVVFRGPYLPQAVWSTLAVRAGFGPIVDIRAVRSGEIGGYVTKTLGGYLTKSLTARYPAHTRRFSFSQGWAPAWIPSARRGAKTAPSEWRLFRPSVEGWESFRAWRNAVAVASQRAGRRPGAAGADP